ncbi:hypothetical protein SCUCBS95973_006650 [Sporothrix curviconia]|uniref:Putative transcription factor kapC n=1 Tax=Sporothrix curviconia TaxID=1260050 RepID=A0ABP0C782_9PEZI
MSLRRVYEYYTSPESSRPLDDFDAEASLLTLQQHVNAAANGAVETSTSTPAFAHGALASNNSIAYAASAALLAARAVDASETPAPSSHSEAEIHPDLRSAYFPSEQLPQPLPQSQYPPLAPANMSSAVTPSAPVAQAVAAPQPQAAAIAAPPQPISPKLADESAPEAVTDGRRGPRRELSTSKRAAQNRAAQRAFRQRKEGYIKKLEKQVQDFAEMENSYKITQSENYALREYIIHLQSRLLDAKAELPQPPANLNLAAPGMPPIMSIGHPPVAMAQQQQQQQRHEQQIQQQMQLQQQQALEQQEQQRQLQRLRDLEQQKASASSAAQEASASAPAETPAAATESPATTPSDIKNESSLARVAQAVAQLGNSEAAASSAKDGANGKTTAENGGEGEPMDTTTDEALTQSLQKLSEPVASM